jgi:hypothetical protein
LDARGQQKETAEPASDNHRPTGMRWIAIVVTALCGVTLGFAARDAEPLPSPPIVKSLQPLVVEPVAAAYAPDTRPSNSSQRNLFGYVEQEARPANPVKAAVPRTVVVESQPAPIAEPPVPREPELGFRYIGTFGRAHDPIAVFARDGDIVNARTGDAVGEFKVERAGFDGVNIRSAATSGVRTIPNAR